MVLTLGSLFSGIGGLELGFERTGKFKTIWHCEVDPHASKVLDKHWPDVPNLGDITEVNWDEIERPDIIVGGFPCQDISIAGKGRGITGKNSGLWWEMHKAVSVLRPSYVVVENVPMLTYRGLGGVLTSLSQIRYDAEWNIVSAGYVGAPHRRERIFIIAYDDSLRRSRNGKNEREFELGNNAQHISSSLCKEISNPDKEYALRGRSREGEIRRSKVPDPARIGRRGWDVRGDGIQRHVDPIIRGWNHNGGRDAFNDSRKWWETESSVGRVANGIPRRVDRLRCLGNAVVPQVAEYIARLLLKQMEIYDAG